MLLFVPGPQVQLPWLCGDGLGIGVLQFGFVYVGTAAGMPSGLAGLLLQSSAPFTMLLAGVFLREKISRRQVIGIGVAVLGLAAIIAFQAQAQAPKPLHLTMWMSLFPPIPMFLLSLLFEGPGRIARTFTTLTNWSAWVPAFALLYIVIFAGLVAYGLWNALLARNPASQVAPYSMMMPAFGVAASWIILGESMTVLQTIVGLAVIAGVLYASRPS
ncbi:EamA family transporter [Streptomyces sp. NPDC058665]|uniref:EamA family transporter n=1 Tax=Streptomyces sp. NPDC058665 TaxID=3346586 RepID=UPI003649D913